MKYKYAAHFNSHMLFLSFSLSLSLSSLQSLSNLLHTLDTQAVAKAVKRFEDMYPALSPDKIQDAVTYYFPDDVAPMKELNLLDSSKQQRAHLTAALEEAHSALADVKRRRVEFAAEAESLLEQKRRREAEIRSLPLSQERAFMEMVDGMKWQKDEAKMEERERREREEEERHTATVTSLQAELATIDDVTIQQTRQQLRDQWAGKRDAPASAEREREMTRRVVDLRREREREREVREMHTESKVAEVLQNKMGTERFMRLQEGKQNEDSFCFFTSFLFLISFLLVFYQTLLSLIV